MSECSIAWMAGFGTDCVTGLQGGYIICYVSCSRLRSQTICAPFFDWRSALSFSAMSCVATSYSVLLGMQVLSLLVSLVSQCSWRDKECQKMPAELWTNSVSPLNGIRRWRRMFLLLINQIHVQAAPTDTLVNLALTKRLHNQHTFPLFPLSSKQ